MSAASKLRVCPIQSVAPFALTLAPVYVFLKRNGKFISVKAPLDFFTPTELERLKPLGNFYLPKFIDAVEPFRRAGRAVRTLLKWEPKDPDPKLAYPAVALPISPYELSDGILRIIGPLWGKGKVIEPFFISAFANELCDYLPGVILQKARDKDIRLYELAVLRSSCAVFLALHLGFCNLRFLNELRYRVFIETVSEKAVHASGSASEVDDLVQLVSWLLNQNEYKSIEGASFEQRDDRISQKMTSRLRRVAQEFINEKEAVPTIYGPGGFVNV